MIDYNIISPLAYADDDDDDRMFFQEAIQEIFPDIRMKLFSNGKLLLAYIVSSLSEENLPRLIFLDLNMPVMNGIECLLELKKNISTTNIPIVIFTTSSYEGDRLKLKDMGVNYFFTKETSFEKIQLQLKNIIDTFCQNKSYSNN
ncbi:response regulator [Zobellia sp. 1_MG-2023]|uniref:response regulator n=1 Tax=Zobellia sp. 1_MG-2023 TaxID=3062626 RepID=UPI0026E42C76|nr:response regulator [Zobellia sp. 1_MG-2023]MDO6818919.1 response regulator [Zobellia sp. 1_MG-2023]